MINKYTLYVHLNSNYSKMVWSFGIKTIKYKLEYKGHFKYKFNQDSGSNPSGSNFNIFIFQ